MPGNIGEPPGGVAKGNVNIPGGGPAWTAPGATPKGPIPSGTTGGQGGGIFGGGAKGGGITSLPHWRQFKIPSWYHGLWPLSKMADTIRDVEFALLGDLSQWNYNAQQFNGCSLILNIIAPPSLQIPDGILVSVEIGDPSGNPIGGNGGTDQLAPSVAVDVDGKYSLTGSYVINVQLLNFTVSRPITYVFPGVSVTGAVLKAGVSLALDINAQQWAAAQAAD